jgi:hypothetical protein
MLLQTNKSCSKSEAYACYFSWFKLICIYCSKVDLDSLQVCAHRAFHILVVVLVLISECYNLWTLWTYRRTILRALFQNSKLSSIVPIVLLFGSVIVDSIFEILFVVYVGALFFTLRFDTCYMRANKLQQLRNVCLLYFSWFELTGGSRPGRIDFSCKIQSLGVY